MFQELLSKLAAKRAPKASFSNSNSGNKAPKNGMKTAFRSLAIKRKVKGKGFKSKVDSGSMNY